MNIVIILVGIYGVITCRNLIRKVMCLAIVEGMVVFQFLSVGYRAGARAPILGQGGTVFADPVPHALMLTAIVIGVCFNALAVAIIVKLHQKQGSVDVGDLHDI